MIILASTNLPIDLILKCQLGKIISLNVMALIPQNCQSQDSHDFARL
jgi:hypothetical protein